MKEEDVKKLQEDLKGFEAEVANTLRVSPSILNGMFEFSAMLSLTRTCRFIRVVSLKLKLTVTSIRTIKEDEDNSQLNSAGRDMMYI